MSGGALIFSILVFLKKFPFCIETSTWFDYHIWLDLKIKLLVSIWNVKLVWNELTSSSSSLQCKDKQLRLLIVYNKIKDLPKISYEMCNIKMGGYLEQSMSVPLETFQSHTLLKTTRNWVRQIKPLTIKKHVFPQSNTFRYQPEKKICFCDVFLHHFIRFYYDTS